MVYVSGKVDCYGAYDYVIGMMKTIGDIKALRIFYDDHEEYSRVVDGRKEYYKFIIINAEEDEFWIDGICGYSGTGPSCTKKMMEVLGIDGDFRLFKKKEVYIDKVIQQHKMNVLIESKVNDRSVPYLMLRIEFNNAYDRVMFDKVLRTMGYINEYMYKDNLYKDYDEYFKNCVPVYMRYGEYRINNILSLDRGLRNFARDQVKELIETIIVNSNIKGYSLDEV